MRQMNLRSVDLNLLVILQQLLSDRHVTRAAEQLHMSQPAVSRALQRLRDLFDDPLLVSTSDGYDLSARAMDIQSRLDDILQNAELIIANPEFNPETSAQVLNIYGAEPDTALFVPHVLARMMSAAPNMQLAVHSTPQDYFETLTHKDSHFLITSMQPEINTDQFHRLRLSDFEIVAVMRTGHPLAVGPISFDRMASVRHGYVSLTGRGQGTLSKRLQEQGHSAQPALRLTNFTAIPDYCEASNVIFYVPRNYARQILKGRDLVMREMPEEMQFNREGTYLFWHERYHKDPMCIWVREQFRQVIRDLKLDTD